MPFQQAQRRPGIGVGDLAPGVELRCDILSVVDQHRSEDQGKQHVVLRRKLFRLGLLGELVPVGEEHVPIGGNVAGVAGFRVKAVELALVDSDPAGAAVIIEVSAEGQHRIGF